MNIQTLIAFIILSSWVHYTESTFGDAPWHNMKGLADKKTSMHDLLNKWRDAAEKKKDSYAKPPHGSDSDSSDDDTDEERNKHGYKTYTKHKYGDKESSSDSKDSHSKSEDSHGDNKSKDKDSHSNSKDKDSHGNSKDKDSHSKSKDKNSHSNSKDKDSHSKSKDKNSHSNSKDKDSHSNSKDKGSHSNSKDKDSHSKSKDKDSHSNSKDKDSHSKSKDKDSHSNSKDKDSHSKSKDKDSHSNSKDKDSHSKSKDKDSHSKSKDKDSHSNSKDKDSHSKSKDKDSHSKSKDKDSHSNSRDTESSSESAEKDCTGAKLIQHCSSWKYKYARCPVSLGGQKAIKGARVKTQHSSTTCKQGVNWGFDQTSVWVDDGCRADFELCLGAEEECTGEKLIQPCSSWKYQYASCPVPLGGQKAIKGARVKTQHSSTICKQGVNWGFDQTSVWVDDGCRADFELCLAVNGGWSTWSDYGACSKPCGSGSQSRSRTCGGKQCVGDAMEDRSCNTQPCPVNGGWSTWGDYGACSKRCGSGSQSRSRTCTNPAPANGGEPCAGDAMEDRSCNTQSCSVDGGWSTWGEYGACSKRCGSGSQSRFRTCTDPAPQNGGKECIGDAEDDRSCNTSPCPVNGGWSTWGDYGACSKRCGSGSQSRSRTCTNPVPANGGQQCAGDAMEERSCNTQSCPVDGGWSTWGEYGACSKRCGSGSQSRFRTCTDPAPQNGGKECIGDAEDDRSCNTSPCPVNGAWSTWSDYGACTKPCGTGSQVRTRTCSNPAPANGGSDCLGIPEESQSCNTAPCPVDGGWSTWSEYGACSKRCGTGSQSRNRECTNPAPKYGGKACVGDADEEQSCNTEPCPVNGGWTKWSDYGTCSKTCGGGTQTRARSCSNPEPAHGGAACSGVDSEDKPCNTQSCPVNGGWSTWSDYGGCSKTCGTGKQSRSRTCSNPEPMYGGAKCIGSATDEKSCNPEPCPAEEECTGEMLIQPCSSWKYKFDKCPVSLGGQKVIKGARVKTQHSSTSCKQGVNWGFDQTSVWVDDGCRADFELCLGVDGAWTTWNGWSDCSKSCGIGSQSRTRTCSNPPPSSNGADCVGNRDEERECNKDPCPVNGGWTVWSEYVPCSKTCGTGSQSRFRTCTNPEPAFSGENCKGSNSDSRNCNTSPCPVNGGWSDWSGFGTCSKTCGGGSQARTRTCNNPVPSNGGESCVGKNQEEQSCNSNPCPVDGQWTTWSEYGSCSKKCGGGLKARTRTCTNPPPSNNGKACPGDSEQEMPCNNIPCPKDGGWSNWSDFGTCTKSCGGGSQVRTRTCTDPALSDGGAECVGKTQEQQSCNTTPCPVDGEWTTWSEYGSCSKKCGGGVKARTRTCTNPPPSNNGKACPGDSEQEIPCNNIPCPKDGGWSNWSDFGTCTKSCGGGSQVRTRTCTDPAPSDGGAECVGKTQEQQSCNTTPCPVDGQWTTWSEYGSCSKKCGGGVKARTRTCTNPPPSNNGKTCPGDSEQEIPCNNIPCPKDGGWSKWSDFGTCTKSCGGGSQVRTRTCTDPAPSDGGDDCVGKTQEQQSCNTNPCSADGGWSKWSPYSPCSKPCGSGKQSRTRTCSNPAPSGPGAADCDGDAREVRECNASPCPSGDDTMKPPYKKPKKCDVKQPCCEPGRLTVNMASKKFKLKKKTDGALKGVKVGKFGRATAKPCSQPVLITVDFERIDNSSCFGCLESPYCGRRMLKIELELSMSGRGGWLFNVGDSQSNNGYRGDSNHQQNDAEVQGLYPNITVYPSDRCPSIDRIMHIIDGATNNVHTVTLYVSNEHVRITNNDGLDYRVCSGCLFALNGQSDSGPIGSENDRMFIGLNRVIDSLSRVGHGVCSATLNWMCPWCD